MILRRIASAFRRQDWFTVFVETMIVVMGVFLGLQVNNWNGERADREREDVIMTRLAADFTQLEAAARAGVAAAERRIETIDDLIVQLRQEDAPDVEAIAASFVDALAYSRPVGMSPIYSEITSTGEFSLLQSESLRISLSQYAEVRDMQAKVIDYIGSTITGDPDYLSVQAAANYYSRFDQRWLEPRLAEHFAQPVMIDRLLISRTIQDGWLFWNEQALEKTRAVLTALSEARGHPPPDFSAPPAGETE